MSGMYTSGLIGLTEENVGIDRRFYTNRTDTNPTLAVSYNNGRVDVYLNGVKLVGNHAGNSNHDYTMDNVTGTGTTITLATGVALVATDVLELVGYVSNSSNTVQTYNFNVTTNTTAFTASHTASSLVNVYLNGVLLDSSDYTLNGSDTVTLGSNAVNGDVVAIQVIGALDYSNFVPESGGTFSGNVAINSAKLEVTQPASDQSGGAAIKAIGTAYSTNKAFHAYMNTSNTSKSLIYAENSSGGVFNVAGDGNVGIGVDDPISPVHINVNATDSIPTNLLVQQGDDNVIALRNTNNSANYSGIKLEARTSGASGWLIANEWQSTYKGDLVFRGRNASSTSEERMRIDSSGHVTMPNQPAFRAENSGDVATLSTNVALSTQGTWTCPVNRGNNFNTTNGTFTAPVTGAYMISYGITVSSNNNSAGDGWSANIYLNNSPYFDVEINYAQGSVSGEERHSGNTLVMQLIKDDAIQVGTDGLNGSTSFAVLYATLSGHLIG